MGRRPAVAAGLSDAGVAVTVTDVVAADEVDAPPSVSFVRDDIVAASERDHPGEIYEAALVYGLNFPPELHRPALNVARAVDADFQFMLFGYDSVAGVCETEAVTEGDTGYVARGV